MLALLALAGSAHAVEICVLPAQLRDLDSEVTSEHSLITSTRFMRHLWVTDEVWGIGRRGLLATAQHGRHDPGGIWLHWAEWGAATPAWQDLLRIDSGYRVVSDGILDAERTLHIVVSGTFDGDFHQGVEYHRLTYNPDTELWEKAPVSIVFASGAGRATIARELGVAESRLWCAYTANDGIDSVQVKVSYSTDEGDTWNAAAQVFGSKNLAPRKSARIIAFADRIGLLFHDDGDSTRSKHFAFRDNADDPLAPWTVAPIDTMAAPYDAITSMHLHWSLAAASNGELHFVYQDEGVDFGARYASGTLEGDAVTWTIPPIGTQSGEFPPSNATYPQVSIDANDRPYVFLDQDYSVWATAQGDGSWAPLLKVSATEDTICGNKRVNTPANFCDLLPFAYQVYDCDTTLTSLDFGVAIDCCSTCCQ